MRTPPHAHAIRTFPSFCAEPSRRLTTDLGDAVLTVRREGLVLARLSCEAGLDPRSVVIEQMDVEGDERLPVVAAALEAVLARSPMADHFRLGPASEPNSPLLEGGFAVLEAGEVVVLPELLWQQPWLWLPRASGTPFPQAHVLTDGRRHPRRPLKPKGTVYARFIPWLGQVLSFRAAALDQDLNRLNRWMNDPRVAVIWEEAGDLAHHRAYLEARIADTHLLPLIGCFDDEPFGYFELYWAKENRLGPHYDADDYDRGWHVLVGEDAFRGKAWITAWLPSLMHFMFLDDPRTQRIVGEPRATHAQQIRNLDRSGFAKVKHVDFPHKRALLVMLLRERFFGDRLWASDFAEAPEADAAGVQTSRAAASASRDPVRQPIMSSP